MGSEMCIRDSYLTAFHSQTQAQLSISRIQCYWRFPIEYFPQRPLFSRAETNALFSPRQIFSMDAGHLKGAWNGVMLTLSCKDSDNKIIYSSARTRSPCGTKSHVATSSRPPKVRSVMDRAGGAVSVRLHQYRSSSRKSMSDR